LEIAHIVPWAEVKVHEFHNLIALRANHHRRQERGEIDRKAIRQIKENLSLSGSRYTELERRITPRSPGHARTPLRSTGRWS